MALVTFLSLISSLPFFHLNLIFFFFLPSSANSATIITSSFPTSPLGRAHGGAQLEIILGRRPEPYHRQPSIHLDFPWEAIVSHRIVLSKTRIFQKDISDSYVSNGLEVSVILISNSALTLDFLPCDDALTIGFSSAFSLVTY